MSKILIIDDDKDVLIAAEQYLQKNNEDVFTATGGSKGLRVLKQETIDCIVLDVLLKGESGFDLCRKIRSFSSVPIVFLTKILTFLRNYTNINRFFMRSLLWLYVWKAMLLTACLAGIVE